MRIGNETVANEREREGEDERERKNGRDVWQQRSCDRMKKKARKKTKKTARIITINYYQVDCVCL